MGHLGTVRAADPGRFDQPQPDLAVMVGQAAGHAVGRDGGRRGQALVADNGRISRMMRAPTRMITTRMYMISAAGP